MEFSPFSFVFVFVFIFVFRSLPPGASQPRTCVPTLLGGPPNCIQGPTSREDLRESWEGRRAKKKNENGEYSVAVVIVTTVVVAIVVVADVVDVVIVTVVVVITQNTKLRQCLH